MRSSLGILAGVVALTIGSGPGRVAAQGAPSSEKPGLPAWVHVRVEEAGKDKPSRVAVNLPMGVVTALAESAPQHLAQVRKCHIGHGADEVKLSEIRKAWAQLRSAGDMEFVTIEDEDATIRIARAGGKVVVDVDGAKGAKSASKGERVRAELPVDVVDALLSGEGEDLNVAAALDRLQHVRGDIVRVEDGESVVRVWIDEKS